MSTDNSLHARALAEAKVLAMMPTLPAALLNTNTHARTHTHTHTQKTLRGVACSSCRPLMSTDNSLHARALAEAKVLAMMPTLPAASLNINTHARTHTHTHTRIHKKRSGGLHAQAVAHLCRRTTHFTPALLQRLRSLL
jgi:hypothetical protein